MATENLEYLDESGLNRTAGNVLAKIAEIKAQIEEELGSLDYAKPDGVYPDMTVGAVIGADETAQWATRESAGTGSAIVRSVQGAAVAWNQMVDPVNKEVTNNGMLYVCADNIVTLSGIATGTFRVTINKATSAIDVISGHKYIVKGGNSALGVALSVDGISGAMYGDAIYTGNTTTSGKPITVTCANGTDLSTPYTFRPQLFDLTAMFGSGNEPSTVAEFERMYPAAYYPYSAPVLKPVQISGFRSTDAQGNALDSVEWTAQTLRAVGNVADVLTENELVTRIGVVDLGTLEWSKVAALTDESGYRFQASLTGASAPIGSTMCRCAELEVVPVPASFNNISKSQIFKYTTSVQAGGDSSLTQAQFKAAMSGVYLYYELATPTTTPISPALPMTYRVQQGGSESIIVPDGEISAAPIITIAEPVNMGTELAQIWAAIEALQGSQQALQSDVRSDVQEITAELTPIDVTKEVQQTDEDREVSE